MGDMLNGAQSQVSDVRDGMSQVEVCGIVAALVVFASIYTDIVVDALRSTPW